MSAKSEIETIITEQLGVNREEITLEKSLIEDLNADSLDLTELVMTLEEHFEIQVPQGEAEKLQTVGDLVKYVDEKKSQ